MRSRSPCHQKKKHVDDVILHWGHILLSTTTILPTLSIAAEDTEIDAHSTQDERVEISDEPPSLQGSFPSSVDQSVACTMRCGSISMFYFPSVLIQLTNNRLKTQTGSYSSPTQTTTMPPGVRFFV